MIAMTEDLARLRKCVLMLSSQHDGEVLSAARSINRILGSSHLDWHWLADRIDGGTEPVDWEAKVREAYDLGRKSAQPAWRDVGEHFADHQAAAEWLFDNHGSRLRDKDRDFLETMLDWRGRPTERQSKWLNDLCRRFGYRP
jgi:hypothetical protein